MTRSSADTGHVPPGLVARLAQEGQQPDPKNTFSRFRLDRPTSVPTPAKASPPARSHSPLGSSPKRKRNLHVRQKGEPAACQRCRRLKKRCSRTEPQCSQCLAGGLSCSFARSPGVSETASGSNVNLQEPLSNSGAIQSANGSARVSVSENTEANQISLHGAQPVKTGVPVHEVQEQIRHQNHGSLSRQIRQRIPEDAAGRAFVNAYFRHIHRAYPFMDKAKLLEDVEAMGDMLTSGIENISTNLYMVMALGCYTMTRAGQVSDTISAKFKISQQGMLQVMQKSLSRPKDIESVQTLLLLGLYCLFDPTGLSPYMITALLASQVMSLGLSRKSLPEQWVLPSEIEMRHRLFWSIFTLDRMVSVSSGLPFNLHDENTDLPLPGLTVEEFNGPDKGYHALILQVHRQVVSLRQLEETLVQKVHLTNATTIALMPQSERHSTLQALRFRIDEWYRTGCLLTPMEETDQIPFHNTIPWLNHRYQNLMLLLYSPSNLNQVISADHFGELEKSLQKYIQLSSVLIQKRHLPLNWVTLCRFVAICPLLLYCLMRRQYEQAASPLKDENKVCAEILEAFPERWRFAKRSAEVFLNMSVLPLAEVNQQVASLVTDMLGDCSMYKKAVEASALLLEENTIPSVANSTEHLLIGQEFNMGDDELWAGIGDFGMEFM
ncbi:hypothetical protein BP6252_03708 [Coleophoma cylindrospora]|uniref:Zn(2)-C6 fungal-type domain-containing protein n=1 Tax=Coleophoma cylindrospora TaxID=1849047 RepID=A0A3D8S8D8_9HELO|nr:hypothetical protein BP6252_03708 [Coleophoma cylindrospora]